MNRIAAMAVLVSASMAFTAGCTTKKSVNAQITPVMNKVNELDDMTAKTNRDIKDLDTRTTQGVNDVNTRLAGVEQKTTSASAQADQAQQLANNTAHGVDVLQTRVANLDNYHPIAETSVKFGFNKATLDKKARADLDQLVQQTANNKNYIVQVEGGTDSVGSADYNYQLSQHRAAAVVQYLAEQHGIPAHRIYVIGLGKDKPVAENRDSHGRAENRRVDVRIMTNTVADQNAPTTAQQ
ncbi:MAG TPA: OmpA family protein [Candidatus Acidoferrales bacterium]|nr:OmpA family protein [Candidatus Acidoferrales bacterium]